jgi:hypothetical protein
MLTIRNAAYPLTFHERLQLRVAQLRLPFFVHPGALNAQ